MPEVQPPTKTIEQIVDDVGLYPIDAFNFVHEALEFTVSRIHVQGESGSQHVDGRQLCQGIRDYATQRWGLLARTVLSRWGVTSTYDFGRIVFALVENGHLSKTDNDTLNDFRNIYDFRQAFDGEYQISESS